MHQINDLKTRDGIDIFEFLFNQNNFYQLITIFSFYVVEDGRFIKYMAAPHQIAAVLNTINRLKIAGDNRGGVV